MNDQSMTGESSIGRKNDDNKTRWSLLPWETISQIVDVMEHGAVKYGRNNWQYVNPPMRYWDAAMRHMIAYANGERLDESTHHHLAHALTSIMFLLWHDDKNWETVLEEALASINKGANNDTD